MPWNEDGLPLISSHQYLEDRSPEDGSLVASGIYSANEAVSPLLHPLQFSDIENGTTDSSKELLDWIYLRRDSNYDCLQTVSLPGSDSIGGCWTMIRNGYPSYLNHSVDSWDGRVYQNSPLQTEYNQDAASSCADFQSAAPLYADNRHLDLASQYGSSPTCSDLESIDTMMLTPSAVTGVEPYKWISRNPDKTREAKLFRCPVCFKPYARRDTMTRHKAKHEQHAHVCLLCPRSEKIRSFARKDHLAQHYRLCHPGRERIAQHDIADAKKDVLNEFMDQLKITLENNDAAMDSLMRKRNELSSSQLAQFVVESTMKTVNNIQPDG